jgi:predicted dehydrogenase
MAGSEPETVYGVGDRAVNFETELLDNCIVVVNYPDGVKASLMMCLMDPFHEHYDMEIIGNVGRMTIDVKRSEICYYLFEHNVSASITVKPIPGKEEAMHPGTRKELEAFIDSIQNSTKPAMNAAAAARICALSLAIEESFTTGTIIEVPHIPDAG